MTYGCIEITPADDRAMGLSAAEVGDLCGDVGLDPFQGFPRTPYCLSHWAHNFQSDKDSLIGVLRTRGAGMLAPMTRVRAKNCRPRRAQSPGTGKFIVHLLETVMSVSRQYFQKSKIERRGKQKQSR